MAKGGGRLQGQTFASLAYGNCRDLPHVWKVNLGPVLPNEEFQLEFPCTTQEDNVTTRFVRYITGVSIQWSLTGGQKQQKMSNF